ncbi:MAG: UDP-N-acetylglucosamine 1-carboxyvinyltransferase [Candidatus Dojkabacteria bacterium]|nr:UDP-N-acetylglucosamine 1-carboxyvinyltransferase [Candidatus Dojkabacteria bacterium]
MHKISINGPNKLSGTVEVQGAKNSAMKLLAATLTTGDKFVLDNVPDITSSQNFIEILKQNGGTVEKLENNKLKIDTSPVKKVRQISKELFFHTSGAIHLIPQITARFDQCEVEKDPERADTGGDKIGSRPFDKVIQMFRECGINCTETETSFTFRKVSDKPFSYTVPIESFSASVNAVLCALFKNGESRILKPTPETEFKELIDFLIQMGAKINYTEEAITVKGNLPLSGTNYKIMPDRHDFVTWVSAALTTNSDIQIDNVDYKKMRLEQMEKVKNEMGFDLEFSGSSCLVHANTFNLKPLTLEGGRYPAFQTEWQVLFAPVVTQIKGRSRIIELLYPNRMGHWEELAKMGAKFKYINTGKVPEFAIHKTALDADTKNAVEITGPQKLIGSKVQALDVRAGAAALIAGLIAEGTTEISGAEHIERGYENIAERLQILGADIVNCRMRSPTE